MKGAYILAQDTEIFAPFVDYLKRLELPFDEADNSIRLYGKGSHSFTFYDRMSERNYFEDHEIPLELKEQGFRYGFLVECRSEALFCEIVNSLPDDFNILVFDGDGELFRPGQLTPDTLIL